MKEPTRKELLDELAELRLRLEEAEDTLGAIRHGEVEALVVSGPEGHRVFTLKGADHFYRVLVETINAGVATLGRDGTILYANRRLAHLLQIPLERVIGSRIDDYVTGQDQPKFEALLRLRREDNRGEVQLRAANGQEVPTLVSVGLLPQDEGPDKLCLVVTDLTEQKRQEEILAAERLSRAILDQAEQAIVVCNDKGVITQASQAAQRLYDGNPLLQQFEEAFPLGFQVQESGADFSETGFPLTGVLQGVIYQGVEAIFQRQDGQEFHVILNAGPLLDEKGAVLGGIVSLTDITARKEAEEALRTQAQILKSMAEGVTVTDYRGYILYTNPAFDAMFGYEAGELVGQHSNVLNHYPSEENLRVVKEILRQVNAAGVWVGEFYNCRKKGEPFFTSARVSALELGGKKLFISVQEDITERKQAQEMLRRQAELLDLAEDAILVRDMVGRITYWNRGAEELYGWSREEAMGRVVHQLLHTEYPKPLVDIETQVIEQGRWEGEVGHTTRDGRRLIVECRWNLKRDKQGRPLAILNINKNVTARRRAEEALKKSERRFQRLVEANIIGMAVSSEETVVEANDAFLQMLGYTREEMYAGEINWVELTPHEYLSQDAQALYELRATGAHTPFEKVFSRRNGSQVAVMVGGALLEEDPMIWVSFVLDISERKQLEAALRQSEARFRAIFSNASIGIATTDLKGHFQQFNAPVVKGLGYTPTELRGMTFFDVTHPEDIDKDADLFAELAAGRRERYQVEKRYVRKDGWVLWGWVHVSLARNMAGDPEFAVSLVEDITARQEAQAALAESEVRYRSLVEMSPDAIVVHAKGRIIFTNQAGVKLFGAAGPGEVLGQHIMDLVHPDFQEIVKRRVKRGYAGERADLREIKLRRFDGQTIDVESSAAPITYQGEPAVQVVVRDISERKRAEEEIRRLASFPELNPLPIMEVDEEGRVLYANPAAQRAAAKLDLPEGVRAFLPENLKEIFTDVRDGGPRGYSYDLEFDQASYAVTLHFPHDLPTARFYAMDITERRRAEEALQQSEARERARAVELQTILDATPGVILLTHDPEGRVITGNRAAYELMRRAPGSNLSKSAEDGERPENFRTMQNGREITGAELPVQRAATGETVRNVELDMVFDDGTVRHVLGDAVPLPDEAGQPRGSVAVFVDITERKRMEEALDRRQAEFEAIFNSISDGVIFADPERRIVRANPAAETLFGYAREEMLGRTMEFIYASSEDYQEQGRRRYHTRPDHPYPAYEIDYRRQDGSVFPAEAKGSQVKDAQGRVIGFVSIHRDITERKQAEAELARHRELLQAIIDNIPVMLSFYNPNLKTFRFNKESSRVLGWSEEDVAVDDPMELFYPDPEYREMVREYMQSLEPGWRDFQVTAKDGDVVDSTWANIRLTDDTHIGIGMDIRERKRMEKVLRESEEQARRQLDEIELIYQSAPVGLAFIDLDLRYMRVNERLAETNGVPAEEHLGRTPREVLPELGPRIEELLQGIIETGEPALNLEISGITPAQPGVRRTWKAQYVPQKDAAGRVIGVSAVVEEITERKRAEEALRESREDLNRAQAVARTGSWRLNVQKNELTWSEENHRIFGIPPGTPLTYESFLGTVHPEDREYVKRKWTAALAGQPYDLEHRLLVGDTVKWVRERAELEFDAEGRLLGGFGTTQDITGQKLAQEALRQSEARYRAIGELIPFGIWTAGPDGGWDYVSKSFLKMAGKSLEDCQGFGWLNLLPYGDTQPTLKAWQYCLETGSFWDHEYKIHGKDGLYRTILSRGLPLADQQGRITSWVGINLDITERKEMEEALRRAHHELEKRVADRTAALRLANEQLLWEIEERQQAEDRLRQSEARFTAFMQYLPGAAVMRDIQGRYLFANEAWERLTGQTRGEWSGKTAEDIWPLEVAKTIMDADFGILSTGLAAEHLEELELVDGRHYFLTHRFPIPDESGLPYMVGSIALDITARQRAEEALAAERLRLFAVLETMPAYVALLAPDYTVPFANQEFVRRFGKAAEGDRCYEFLFGRQEPCPDCRTFRVFKANQPEQWEWLGPDGQIYAVYDYPFTDTDGSPLVLEMGIDITRRKQAETAAAQQAALVAGINRILREALTSETEEKLGHTCLTVAEELTDSQFGFIDEINKKGNLDVLAMSDPGWDLCNIPIVKAPLHLTDLPQMGLLARPIRDGQSLIANDPASHPDAAGTPAGHPPLTAYLGVPLTYGDQTIGLLGLGNKAGGYTDTDRETMEILAPAMMEALMHHRAAKDLKISENKLRFLADQLLTAQENERKRLAAELHDELGHALLALKLALSSMAKELLPTQEDLKQDIQDQLEYINGVINEVRRLYHDLIPGNVEDLGLTKALRTLVEDFADLQEDTEWEVDLPNLDGLFSLPVQTIIYRLMQESLTNIGKHAEPSQVRVSAAREDGRVHFVIQDDGQGFNTEKVLHHAEGLGLVAMEERLNMVGGTFEVWSKKGEGTKISFAIPTRPREEKA